MKKQLLALATLCPLAGVVHAQSSVTLYGLIDEGFEAVSNVPVAGKTGGGTKYALDAINGLNGTRWGLRGTEDLGGGLAAIFTLENGFDLNTGKLGQGGAEFGRQAFVGLSSSRFGTLTLGRQYDSVVDYLGNFEFGDSNVGTAHSAHPGDLDNFNNSRRTNNAIKFRSIDYSGLTFGGIYSLGGVAGSFTTDQVYSLGVGYKQGPLAMGVAYLNVKNPAASLFGSNPADTATSNGLTGTPVFSGYATAQSYQVIGWGGSYALGAAVFGATYSNIRFGDIAALARSTAVFNDAEASFQYHVTPAFLAGISYNYTRGSEVTGKVGGVNYNQFAIGANYTLSPRTDVYAAVVYQTVNGRDSTGAPAVANVNGVSPSTNQHQAVGRLGIRTRF
ncbi:MULTISPECIES: porin [Paraburkholderia]|jgi:predicted porin|uniref:Porin n=1 Tax=Paraburkholderia madseniana TaxID=2599607 RepID=A0A6N6WKB3_9BURK|nr:MULTISPECIES: porin [Paraburkholderia]KAE8760479.1 porin [Paraburkholderia madseniana]MCX4144944.1 porin [Paraburkholderia madseniana]MCX4177420.1 porin [Paraburkholderia madseniana]MDN7147896.1 porin [Paraburkholderia sp. WS6]MDQ6406776.1 porin [Paraburkholderia madseniana]